MTIPDNIERIISNIHDAQKKSGISQKVTTICVSKYHTVDEAWEVYQSGLRHFAENYSEGFLEKEAALPEDIVWHFIGSLQSRKVKEVINKIDYFHALDRLKLAKEIEKRANHPIKCFVQVNVSGEATKNGISPEEVLPFIEALQGYQKIRVVGLMTMAPAEAEESYLHTLFKTLRGLRDQVQKKAYQYAPCTELSMGMSGDYVIAVEEGATFLRIGSAFFTTR